MIVRLFEKTSLFFIVFFIVFFFSLFLGDGQRTIIDIYWVGALAIFAALFMYSGKTLRVFSSTEKIVWGIVFIAQAASLVMSDSIGDSIYATARLFIGYGIYRLFSSEASKKNAKIFVIGSILVISAAFIVSVIYHASPLLSQRLPPMNLLVLRHGHNHFAVLLVFIFPLFAVCMHRRRMGFLLAVVLMMGLVFTFARTAWIILIGYFVYHIVLNRQRIITAFSFAVLVVVAIGYVGVRGITSTPFPEIRTLPLSMFEKPAWDKSRLPYWSQAIETFLDQPVTGSGPGTFYIHSSRLASAEGLSSWFAHSFPLQVLAETGIIGFLTITALFFIVVSKAYKSLRSDAMHRALFESVVLVLIYALFDFTLSFLSVWVLIWAGIGVLAGQGKVSARRSTKIDIWALLPSAFLIVFYVTYVVGLVVASSGHFLAAFVVSPYVAEHAILYLENSDPASVRSHDERLIRTLYARQPDVILALAQWEDSKGNTQQALSDYVLALSLNSKDSDTRLELADRYRVYGDLTKTLELYAGVLEAPKRTRYDYNQAINGLKQMGGRYYLERDWQRLAKTYSLLLQYEPYTDDVFSKHYSVGDDIRRLLYENEVEEAFDIAMAFLSMWKNSNIREYFEKENDIYQDMIASVGVFIAKDVTKEAIQILKALIEVIPHKEEAYPLLAQMVYEKGDAEALRVLARQCWDNIHDIRWCAELFRDNNWFVFWKSRAIDTKNSDEKVRSFYVAHRANAWDVETYMLLGSVFSFRGETEALSDLKYECRKMFPAEQICENVGKAY